MSLPAFDTTSYEVLKSDDVMGVLEEILEAQNESFALGLKLGLQLHEVESIHKEYSDPKERLLHILITVLKRNEPRPTWRLVVDALKSPAIKLERLAVRLEAKYCNCHDMPSKTKVLSHEQLQETETQSPHEMIGNLPRFLSFLQPKSILT